jgi:hypothetical protein
MWQMVQTTLDVAYNTRVPIDRLWQIQVLGAKIHSHIQAYVSQPHERGWHSNRIQTDMAHLNEQMGFFEGYDLSDEERAQFRLFSQQWAKYQTALGTVKAQADAGDTDGALLSLAVGGPAEQAHTELMTSLERLTTLRQEYASTREDDNNQAFIDTTFFSVLVVVLQFLVVVGLGILTLIGFFLYRQSTRAQINAP